jgi:hypothetical protein
VTIGAELWFVCHSLDLRSSLENPFVSDKVWSPRPLSAYILLRCL